MSTISLSTSVNKHFLAKLMRLAQARTVLAAEDIVDIHGVMVLKRGAQVLASHHQALSGRKLKKTLESSLLVPDAIDTAQIVARATHQVDACAPLGTILLASGGHGPSALSLLAGATFGPALRMLIELMAQESDDALDHCLRVSLLAVSMAKTLGLAEDDQRAAGLAGLLHDIGELYLDPVYLAGDTSLAPDAWVKLVIHPRLGQMLVNELDAFPLAVGRAVAEHHERFDGSGYPHQVKGGRCSAPGQAVAAAEMIAGFLDQDHPLARAELALKIVPGEQSRELLAAVSSALRTQPDTVLTAPDDDDGDSGESAGRLCARIGAAVQQCELLMQNQPERIRSLAHGALERVRTLERAFISTGLDAYLHQQHGSDGKLLFEKTVATREIQWRLRNIARNLALHANASDEERRAFGGLIALLDNGRDAGRSRHSASVTPIWSAGRAGSAADQARQP